MARCEHCLRETPEPEILRDDAGAVFCCEGCRSVYAFIRGEGLDAFYRRRAVGRGGGRAGRARRGRPGALRAARARAAGRRRADRLHRRRHPLRLLRLAPRARARAHPRRLVRPRELRHPPGAGALGPRAATPARHPAARPRDRLRAQALLRERALPRAPRRGARPARALRHRRLPLLAADDLQRRALRRLLPGDGPGDAPRDGVDRARPHGAGAALRGLPLLRATAAGLRRGALPDGRARSSSAPGRPSPRACTGCSAAARSTSTPRR